MNIFLLNYSIKEVFLDSIVNNSIIEIEGLGYCYITTESVRNHNPHIDDVQTRIVPKFYPYYTPSLSFPDIKSMAETNDIEIRKFITPGLQDFLELYDNIFFADSKNKIIGIVRKLYFNKDDSEEQSYYYNLSFSQGFKDLIDSNNKYYIKELTGKELGQPTKILLELNIANRLQS